MKSIGKVIFSNHIAIVGWARDLAQEEPLQVKLWINGKKVATTLANKFHQKFKDRGIHPTGNCKFVFDYMDLPQDMIYTYPIEITAGADDEQLKGSPIPPLPKKSFFSDSNTGRYFFQHIPKTAGSSFIRMLNDIFRQEVILPNHSWREKYKAYIYLDGLKAISPTSLEEKQLIMGHLPSASMELMPHPIYTVTFLRHPYQRCISRLNFASHRNPAFKLDTWENISHNLRTGLVNMQTQYFADASLENLYYWENGERIDENALKQAKERLEAFNFIGLTERFDESIALAERTFGWRFPKTYHVLKSPQRFNHSLPDQI